MPEAWRTLEDMVRSGKVRYIGSSQYQAWQICLCNDLAERYGWAHFVTTQAHYNLLEREAERELLPFCRAMNVGLLPYFPLANGLLAGRYRPGVPPPPDSRAAAICIAVCTILPRPTSPAEVIVSACKTMTGGH